MPGSKSLPAGEFSSQGVDVISIKHALLVADCLSFRRAAGVLGVEPSAVSRRVKALEDGLGVSLFERLRTGVRVTVAGARFFEEIRGPFVAIDDAVKSAGVAGRGAAGVRNATRFGALHWSSRVSSISTTRSAVFATSARSAFTSVVLPVDVPPATRTLRRCVTALRSTSACWAVMIPAAT